MNPIKFLYDSYMESELDERTKDWWPIKHEWLMWTILAAYLYIVKQLGPKYMENRRPYNLKTFLVCYNTFQIIYNTWIVYAYIKYGLFSDIGLGCEYVDRSPIGNPMEIAKVCYWVLMLKMIDLVETVVFVLRKKNRQISFLHLYHHVSTIYVTQVGVKIYPGGMVTVPLTLNSFVHVIMYTYYLLSSQGPKLQKIINPFKPYITKIQMVQFIFLLAYGSQALLPSCIVPRWGAIVILTDIFINLILFNNFYKQNYKEKTKNQRKIE